jgi:hypothetical protein
MECFRIERTATRGNNWWVALLFRSDMVHPSQNSLLCSSLHSVYRSFGVSQFIVVLVTHRSILLDFMRCIGMLFASLLPRGNLIKIPMLIDPMDHRYLLGRRPLHPHPFALSIQ